MLQRLDRFRRGRSVLAPTHVASQHVIDWPAVVDAWQILGETDPTACPGTYLVSAWRPSTRRICTSHLRRFAQFGGTVQPRHMQALAEKVLYILSMFAQGQKSAGARGCISALKGVAHLGFADHHQAARLRGQDEELAWGRGLRLLLLVAKGPKRTTFGGKGLGGRIDHRPCRNLWCPWPWAMGGVQHRLVQPTVASGRRRSQALEMPFLARNPLLRAPRSCNTACYPSTHIFSCALCHESSFHQTLILAEKNGFVPEGNNCIGR